MEAQAAGMCGAGLEDRAAQAAEPQDLQGGPLKASAEDRSVPV